jgi:hypothetical protein
MELNMKKIETVEDAVAVIEDLKRQLDEAKAAQTNQKVEELTASLRNANSEKDALQAKLENTDDALKSTKSEYDALKTKHETIEAELGELRTKDRNNQRFAKLEKLGLNLDDAKRERYGRMSDETFDEVFTHIEETRREMINSTEPANAGERVGLIQSMGHHARTAEDRAKQEQGLGVEVREEAEEEAAKAKAKAEEDELDAEETEQTEEQDALDKANRDTGAETQDDEENLSAAQLLAKHVKQLRDNKVNKNKRK